jgi:hypothetical protein
MKPYLLNILHILVHRISEEFTASNFKTEYFLCNLQKLGIHPPKYTLSYPRRQHSIFTAARNTSVTFTSLLTFYLTELSVAQIVTQAVNRKGCERE